MPDILEPQPQPKKRCTIYLDAFNWYFGIFQHRPAWKWLNVQSFFEALRLDEEVVAVKFFTALVDPLLHVSTRRDRQKRYFKALGSLSKVRIILGKYQERTVTCRAAACPRRLEYVVPEEKKTDVNIAVNLLDDALRGLTDSIVIVSGDSDLEPAVEWVRHNRPQIKITVYIPVLGDEGRQRRSDNYYRMGITCKPLPLADIPRHLLPVDVTIGENQTISRPAEWA
jgi:6-hydroxy-3-succinoylpyridine 3-monooxygenase